MTIVLKELRKKSIYHDIYKHLTFIFIFSLTNFVIVFITFVWSKYSCMIINSVIFFLLCAAPDDKLWKKGCSTKRKWSSKINRICLQKIPLTKHFLFDELFDTLRTGTLHFSHWKFFATPIFSSGNLLIR